VKAASQSVPRGSRVLDAGAGICPYKHHFVEAGLEYESADFGQVNKADGALTYVCRLDSIPVADGRFDLVVLTQVLEHLPDPLAVLRELNRVPKPGGKLWLSAPFFYEEHEQPYDFYRYTQFAFRHLLESAAFKVDRIEWLEGYFGTLSYQFHRAGKNLPLSPRDYGGGVIGTAMACLAVGMKPTLLVSARLFANVDLRHKFTRKGHCKNYAAVAERV